jgi:hypothetical protein
MTEKLLLTTKTPVSAPDFTRALLKVWPAATEAGAGVLWAHYAGETGGGAYCWNFNLGNHKHVRGDGYDYVSLNGVWEGLRFKDEDGDGDIDADDRVLFVNRMVRSGLWIEDKSAKSADHAKAVGPGKVSLIATKSNAATWFRAYPSLDAGMSAFVKGKRPVEGDSPERQPRYASAWRFIEAGDPDGYARELGRKGYYTADPNVYAASLVKRHAAWMASSAFDDVVAELEVTPIPEARKTPTIPGPGPIVRPPVDFEPRNYDEGPGKDDDGKPPPEGDA